PPVINSFSPGSGPVGTPVTITGANFSTVPAANIVYFGAVKVTVTAATSTSLTVTVPTAASYQPVSVTTNNLTGFSAQSFVVTFPGGAGPFTGNSFAAKINTTAIASAYPYKSVAADFDGDGKADIADVNYGTGSISVFRNIGSAGTISLAAKQDFITNAVPVSIAIGDVDGDGKPDMVVTNEGATPMVSVFLNTSTAGVISFAARADYASGAAAYYTPSGVAVKDLDGDGLADLAIANSNGILAVYRNTGGPGVLSFDPIKTFAIPGGQERLAATDVDGDGKADLLVSNSGAASVSVFRNTGSGGTISFGTRQDFTTGNGPVDIAFGDLDNDGKADIAVANGTD
ncbi:MAG TPA: FG-GAP-like repeat-containing protein, partial [Chitinophagaceae bacterium]|nr:FG-GAP-like repeat-containing protein [Chitinophagaceae bacterium]